MFDVFAEAFKEAVIEVATYLGGIAAAVCNKVVSWAVCRLQCSVMGLAVERQQSSRSAYTVGALEPWCHPVSHVDT